LLNLGFLLDGPNFDCVIRTSKLTHSAAYAVIWPGWKNFTVFQLQYMLWAESHTDTAALAIILPNDMKESFFGFSHLLALILYSPHSI